MTRSLALVITLVAACGGGGGIVVEVSGRDAVGTVEQLEITLANAGSTQTETFDLAGHALPTTFSITVGGRSGPIDISARGVTAGATSATGSVSVDASASAADLLLDPADFVVNTEFAGSQSLNEDLETNGYQITAHAGVVTLGFRDDCPVNVCSQLGRRFGPDGAALTTDLGAGTNQFRWNQVDGMFAATVGVASQPDGSSIALWDAPTGVACRPMSADGTASANVITIAPDANPDVVSAVPLTGGSYAVVWAADDAVPQQVIRSTVVSPSCTTVVSPFTVAGPISFANRPTIGATAGNVMIAWMENFSEARFRVGTAGGVFSPVGSTQTGSVLVAGAPDPVDFVRIGATADQFFVLFNQTTPATFTDTLILRRVSGGGVPIGADTILAEGVDFSAPAITVRPADGAVAVTWTQCEAGDGSGCGVYGRMIRPSGVPVGDAFAVNTTTMNDQRDASIAALDDGFVVAFTDGSMVAPDIDMTSVRARYLYPKYDDARLVLGALCDGASDCGPDLVCAEDSRNTSICHPTCDVGGPTPCPIGGTCTDGYCHL